MARKMRAKAGSGIYHVMLRGINRQNVFLDHDDMSCMLRCLFEAQCQKGPDGRVLNRNNCTYYAYCLLHNHMHVLLKEGDLNVSTIMQKVQDRYVRIYNLKYDRVGHLFQDRFASEPVDDEEYFHTLLRYIHRNPVKALEAKAPEDYEYSSWRDYLNAIKAWDITGADPMMSQEGPLYVGRRELCRVDVALKKYGAEELVAWVNVPNADDHCLDMDSTMQILREEDAGEVLLYVSGVDNLEYFKQLPQEYQVEYIKIAMQRGLTIRQASRFSSLTYRMLWNRLNPEKREQELAKRREKRRLAKGK